MNTNPFLFLILLCLLAMIWLLRLAMFRYHSKDLPKPKTTEDCPFCRAEKDKHHDPQAKQALKPWLDVKSPRER